MEDFGIAQLTVANNAEDFAAGICALCQQACEKMLKAFLLAQGKSFAHIHDLRPLGEECAKTLPDLEPLLSELADLTVDFAPSRYPQKWKRASGKAMPDELFGRWSNSKGCSEIVFRSIQNERMPGSNQLSRDGSNRPRGTFPDHGRGNRQTTGRASLRYLDSGSRPREDHPFWVSCPRPDDRGQRFGFSSRMAGRGIAQ